MAFGLFKKEVKRIDGEELKKAIEGEKPIIDRAPPEPKSIEDLKAIEKSEIKNLNKIKDIGPLVKPPELQELKPLPPPPRIITLDETNLKELNEKIDLELAEVKKKLRDIEQVPKLTLESPEMIDLLDLYVSAKEKYQDFVGQINEIDFENLREKRTFAAIYKFRACKGLSEIKKQIKKIESLSMKAGLLPTRIGEILKSDAGKLVNSFVREKK